MLFFKRFGSIDEILNLLIPLELSSSFITSKKPLLTKETANSAMTDGAYSAEKLKHEINFEFTPIQHTIEKYCDWFISDLK